MKLRPLVRALVAALTISAAPHVVVAAGPDSAPTWCGASFDRSVALLARATLNDLPPCAAGGCDDPVIRDGTSPDPIEVRLLVHVMRESDGSGGVSSALVDSMIAQMNRDFAPHAIHVLSLATLFHDDGAFATVATREQLSDLKVAYAQSPSENLNLFISASALPFDGTGVPPWDEDALTAKGGIWLNRELVDGVHHSASHELGHCLGLYHTFHGTTEADSCADACYEPASGFDADALGDLCADTRSTPRNFSCTNPAGGDCFGTPWGATPLQNIMGYGPAHCVNEFTPQQQRRMLCWARAALGSIIVSLADVEPPVADRADPALWTGGMREPSGGARVWFSVPTPGRVTLRLFDVRGRRVATLVDRDEAAGQHQLRWDGRNAAGERTSPGLYLLQLVAAGKAVSGKLIMVR